MHGRGGARRAGAVGLGVRGARHVACMQHGRVHGARRVRVETQNTHHYTFERLGGVTFDTRGTVRYGVLEIGVWRSPALIS